MTTSQLPSIADRPWHGSGSHPRVPSSPRPRLTPRCAVARRIAAFVNTEGDPREVVTCAAASGGLLVIDRDAQTLADPRLIAHLGRDEPHSNAALVCRHYIDDLRRGRPRRVTAEDIGGCSEDIGGPGSSARGVLQAGSGAPTPPLVDPLGATHRLRIVPGATIGIPELRWVRKAPGSRPRVERLREVIGLLQSYEPARSQTEAAVRAAANDPSVSISVLRAELDRIGRSRIVLNRGLREAVVQAMAKEGLSMSCIASRCGRVKRDRRGNLSGETSWLARRLGMAPEGGELRPTPWIHSEVLALIARAGLGIAPREVELG